jgi:hypothetical protein
MGIILLAAVFVRACWWQILLLTAFLFFVFARFRKAKLEHAFGLTALVGGATMFLLMLRFLDKFHESGGFGH